MDSLKLFEKIEAVIKRMRWKAIFFDSNDDQENESTGKYDLKTTNAATDENFS